MISYLKVKSDLMGNSLIIPPIKFKLRENGYFLKGLCLCLTYQRNQTIVISLF